MKRLLIAILVAILVVPACGDDSGGVTLPGTSDPDIGPGTTAPVALAPDEAPQPADSPLVALDAETVARGLDNPVFVTALRGDDRLFVLEKRGVIRLVTDAGVAPDPFLDISDRVEASGLEQGLLGLAFHPRYADNGRFFVYYTDLEGDSHVAEFAVGSDPDRADPASERLVLFQDQPEANHNAGMLEFGMDGYLWVSLGDGGGAGDPGDNAQNRDTLLGSLLRLDVDADEPYSLPPDNPFLAGAGAGEIWAYGLRNPWRFTIDPVEGLIYIGDVGQDRLEEIDVASVFEPALNYGWPVMEGSDCYREEDCRSDGIVLPVIEYEHSEGCSVTGGIVYRGSAIPELWGHYLYGDWCGQWVRSFRYSDGRVTEERDWTSDLGTIGLVQSFGRGGHGEAYVVTSDGFLLRLAPVR